MRSLSHIEINFDIEEVTTKATNAAIIKLITNQQQNEIIKRIVAYIELMHGNEMLKIAFIKN